jgi:hypothetical protein
MARIILPERSTRLLFYIIAVGFLLRIWGLDFGLPHLFHQDEPIVVNHALAYGTGDLNPRFFAIPPFTSYLLFAIYGLMFLIGLILGAWQNSEGFAVFFFNDPTLFYLVGRFFIGVLPGTLAIFLTYRLSRKFLSGKASLYAAAIMSMSFLNVVNSHYIYTDMILTALILLTYERMFLQYRSPNIRNYCATGFFIGLAAGAKYNGAILFLPFFLVHLISERRYSLWILFSRKLWFGALFSLLAFIIVNPFFILDFQGFLTSFLHQSGAFWYTGWTHHITYSLFEGISMPITILGIVGILFFMSGSDKWHKVVALFPLALYLVLVFKSQHFSRYVLFLVPFLSMGAGYFLFDRFRRGIERYHMGRIIVFAAAIFLIPTFIKSIKADLLFSSEDTRVVAADWIKKNIPEGEKIACDSTNFRPVIEQPYSQLIEKREIAASKKETGKDIDLKLEYMIKASNMETKGNPVYFIFEDPSSQGQFLNTLPSLPYDMDMLRSQGIEWVTINGMVSNSSKNAFIAQLEFEGEIVADLIPYRHGVFRGTPDPIATTYMAVKDEDVFSRVLQGPSLRIYRINPEK